VTLLRVLHAEVLKMKGTLALKMVLLSPTVVVFPMIFMVSQAPFSMVHPGTTKAEWIVLAHRNLWVWSFLMMPLFITLQTALVAGLDHSENHWKSLLVRPVPRWMFYAAKLLVVVVMTAAATLLLLCGILISGTILPYLQSDLTFGLPIPLGTILRDGAQVMALMLLALTIQHWVSMRWKSFSVAIGTGIVALVASFFALVAAKEVGGWPQYFPWSLPMLVVAKQPHDLRAALVLSSALGVAVAVVGCWDFCRRDVQ
jgi:lantibiotic transport system permease protein